MSELWFHVNASFLRVVLWFSYVFFFFWCVCVFVTALLHLLTSFLQNYSSIPFKFLWAFASVPLQSLSYCSDKLKTF